MVPSIPTDSSSSDLIDLQGNNDDSLESMNIYATDGDHPMPDEASAGSNDEE
jgi:hypothetical protein